MSPRHHVTTSPRVTQQFPYMTRYLPFSCVATCMLMDFVNSYYWCRVWRFHGADYEDCRIFRVAPWRPCYNWRFGRTCSSIFKVEWIWARNIISSWLIVLSSSLADSIDAEDGKDTFFRNVILTRTERRQIPEDGILVIIWSIKLCS
jgi:hypothetical protein